MAEETKKNDPDEMKKARDASWLCDSFQENNMNTEDKKDFILSLKTKKLKVING